MPMTTFDYILCTAIALLLAPLLAIGSWFFFPFP